MDLFLCKFFNVTKCCGKEEEGRKIETRHFNFMRMNSSTLCNYKMNPASVAGCANFIQFIAFIDLTSSLPVES